MIDLYSWTTPNGRKVSIALEEMGLAYQCHPIDITKGDQHAPHFLALNPNHKIPVLVDDGQVVTESGTILMYLAAKTGLFAPHADTPAYWEMSEWLMWQMAGFGPMLGQAHHFLHYNRGKSDYAEQRYFSEAQRLYAVLNARLTGRRHVLSDLSIVDFAIWPWVSRFEYQQINLRDYSAVYEWYQRLSERPGFQRGYRQPLDVGDIPVA